MSDVMSIVYIVLGSVTLGLLAEAVRALIWAGAFYWAFRRLLR